MVSWQTRQICTFIAAGYMTDGKSENKAIENAMTLSIDAIETEQLLESKKRNASKTPVAKEVQRGSYERFMGSMGSPKRWAGN